MSKTADDARRLGAQADEQRFEGHQPRWCGEHRTTGRRAWCFDCSEWCYPDSPCARCELPGLHNELAAARAQDGPGEPHSPEGDARGGGGGGEGAEGESAPLRDRIRDTLHGRTYGCENYHPVDCDHCTELADAVIPAIRAQIADELERLYSPGSPPIDDQDAAVVNVIRHLRGLCAICGRAPDAEPCGHAHAINLRGES